MLMAPECIDHGQSRATISGVLRREGVGGKKGTICDGGKSASVVGGSTFILGLALFP